MVKAKPAYEVSFHWVVPENDSSGLLLEQLRRAGLLKMEIVLKNRESRGSVAQDKVEYTVIIRSPKEVDGAEWAAAQVKRMTEFGLTATAQMAKRR